MVCTDAEGEVVNIGGAEEIAIKDLAERVKKLACSTSEIKLIPYDVAFTKDFEEMQRRVPSIEKIAKFIDWKPETGLDDAINKVIEFYRVYE
jgi:UDP-glucose 4-epimerase